MDSGAKYSIILEVFSMLKSNGVMPHSITIASVLPACAQLLALEWGREIHYYLIQSGIDTNLFVRNALLDTYAKCQSLEDALHVF